MKAINFIRYLKGLNCHLLLEESNHSIFMNEVNRKISSIPRHKEIKNSLVRKICKDLEIPAPPNFQ